ncbi:PREDICTED: major facilitator superfamily domain-containing protein 12-like [Priapulus caudatus]|uniref:Major facilitator superfamily domain-containing protein 12-like n=1 Tax=Priapulus caudatus TaxID=37621 RepID=A0ABM1E8C2_PRICU|nr:PREDICTED: major facilitator superfamily domain-containing protein 12-like [Priapulus caudatus]
MADQVAVRHPQFGTKKKVAYAVGHVLNDLCASMWFSYLLVFFHSVIGMNNVMAGNLMLVGQAADALSTPFVGLEADGNYIRCGYGKRKTWHLIGTVCVVASFPFLFIMAPGYPNISHIAMFVYYAPLIVVFQFGWAATQVSHLSLIPDLVSDASHRVELTSWRYSATVCANVVVYAGTWLMLDFDETGNAASIGIGDQFVFRNMALFVVGVGLVHSIIFHIGTKEEPSEVSTSLSQCIYDSSGASNWQKMAWKDWFKNPRFYLVAVLYMSTRLYVNVSQVYLPLYLYEAQKLDKDFIARAPLIVFVSGFLTSLLMRYTNDKIGRKMTFLLGASVGMSLSAWIYQYNLGYQIYGVAIVLGIAASTMLVTSLSMVADLIGVNVEGSAFVYGVMSFTDKLSNGVAVNVIQRLHPCKACCIDCRYYFRSVMTFVPGAAAAVGVITLFIIWIAFEDQITQREMSRCNEETRPLCSNVTAADCASYESNLSNQSICDVKCAVDGQASASTH